MPEEPIRLAVITSSPQESKSGPAVARWLVQQAQQFGAFDIDVIDVAQAELPLLVTAEPGPEAQARIEAVSARIEAADAYVVVTAEYNHAYPAVLKSAIDWHATQWKAKPVSFVCYGGRSGGLRAVEQLRQVFAELHVATLRDCVSFADVWNQFDEDGHPKDEPGCSGAAKIMLDQLVWWAQGLRRARAITPYLA